MALGVLGLILAITGLWWALALWPLPSEAPAWLVRTRYVCFNTTETGLPDASGWLLLVGQPLGMLGLLVVGWGQTLREALVRLASQRRGRVVLGGMAALVLAGAWGASARVADARSPFEVDADFGPLPSPDYPRLDRPLPVAALVDQGGETVRASDFGGRVVFVTFAFGHCATVCPTVVHEVIAAREALAEDPRVGSPPAVLVITLDPWRDTPSRLSHIAAEWALPPDVRMLGGTVDQVQSALDEWSIPRSRDPLTGDIVHPAVVYLVDPDGTVAYASTGGVAELAELARRLADV